MSAAPRRVLLDALFAAAVDAVELGWPVFLLGRSKRPLANCPECPKRGEPGAHDPQTCGHLTCHGFYAATCDGDRIEAMITAHPDGLLAVRAGAAPAGAGVVVIDIDPGHGGRHDPGLMTPTLAVATGNHGWHLYYRHPGRPVLSRPLPGAVGVDVKAEGGYVVLPPSVHPVTRRRYEWANRRGIEEMPPLLTATVLTPPAAAVPAVTRRRVAHGSTGSSAGTAAAGGGRIRHPDNLVGACLAAVRAAPEGRRRVTLYGAARGVARVILAGHLTPDTGVDLLTDAGRDADQTDRDIHAAITGGFAAEGLTEGLAHP
ncbi:MAG: DNA primase [Actinophytocola sp.]|uniref:bifunctional DNA primase/polymerase n=1 Tax=Actinophytocola sp. TaxID=1872138 RepID=UPI001322BBA1|nr:bifunctional DNA primase/polymerase [Actinophytocola sp.]MPZ82200.1 DNA primase [Actinophytocola sp.]